MDKEYNTLFRSHEVDIFLHLLYQYKFFLQIYLQFGCLGALIFLYHQENQFLSEGREQTEKKMVKDTMQYRECEKMMNIL